jgi:hypothetical protein
MNKLTKEQLNKLLYEAIKANSINAAKRAYYLGADLYAKCNYMHVSHKVYNNTLEYILDDPNIGQPMRKWVVTTIETERR